MTTMDDGIVRLNNTKGTMIIVYVDDIAFVVEATSADVTEYL